MTKNCYNCKYSSMGITTLICYGFHVEKKVNVNDICKNWRKND